MLESLALFADVDSDSSPATGPTMGPPPLPSTSPTSATPPTKMLGFRSDVHYSSVSNLMTVEIEVPGIQKSDINVKLVVNVYTKVKQVVVTGRSKLSFSEFQQEERDGRSVIRRERKSGDGMRAYNVPFDTKASFRRLRKRATLTLLTRLMTSMSLSKMAS